MSTLPQGWPSVPPPPPPPGPPEPYRPPTLRREWRDAREWARDTVEELTEIEHECLLIALMETAPMWQREAHRTWFHHPDLDPDRQPARAQDVA